MMVVFVWVCVLVFACICGLHVGPNSVGPTWVSCWLSPGLAKGDAIFVLLGILVPGAWGPDLGPQTKM